MRPRRAFAVMGGLAFFLVAHIVTAIQVVSVLRATPATSPITAGTYQGSTSADNLKTSTANTRITLRLSEEDGIRDPRRFMSNVVNFTTELVDASNRVVQMNCGIQFEGAHVIYDVELVEWCPVIQQTLDIPLLRVRETAAESWSSAGTSATDSITFPVEVTPPTTTARRRLLTTNTQAVANLCPDPLPPGRDPVLCNDPQNPVVLGQTLTSQYFNALVSAAEQKASNIDLYINTTSGTATQAQEAQAAEMWNLLSAMQNASTALSDHQKDAERYITKATGDYDTWQKNYNQSVTDLQRVMADNERLVAQGAARTQSLFNSLQLRLLDATDTISLMTNDPTRKDYYESQVLLLATLTQSLIEQVDAMQMENDNDYLLEQTLNTVMSNLYGNVGVRRTLSRLFLAPAATVDQQNQGIVPQSPMQALTSARQLELLVEAARPSLDMTFLTKHYFEAAFVWNTYFDYDLGADTNYWDVDVGATLATIAPDVNVGFPNSALESAAKLIQNGGVGTTTRLYANYRRYDIYCSDAQIVALQNSWTSFLQLQQMLGPDGCTPPSADGTDPGSCRCWAYVRRQRCTLPAGSDATFGASYFAAHPTTEPNAEGVQVPSVPQSLSQLGVICGGIENTDGTPLSGQANWFGISVDHADTGECEASSGDVSPPSASGKPSCERMTDIVAFNNELQQTCNQTVRAEPTTNVITSNRNMAFWVHTQPQAPFYLNVTYGLCNTNYQIMAIQSNLAKTETIPYTFYSQQQAALTQYIKLAARAYDLRTNGYVPKHGTSSQQPYYVQGVMRAANTSQYLVDIQNGVLTTDWKDPVRLLQAQTMTYGAVSRTNIPVYRFTRRQRQQSIEMSCQVPGTDTWVNQAAQDIQIQVDADAYEPTMFTVVGFLDDWYMPAEHDFAEFRNAQGQLVNRTRYTFAVPDEAISSGGPLETRKHKIDYVRCGRTCLDARAKSIDPSYTAADLQQLYNGDPVSLAIDAHLRTSDPPQPGLVFHDAINEQRSLPILAEEYLASEGRDDFDASVMDDSAHHYFHPLVLADGSGFLALQELQSAEDPSYTPILDMSGPIPVQCDMTWFEARNMPPTKQCRFLETHRPIATLATIDPDFKAFESWDKAGFMRFANAQFTTTFSIVVAGSMFIGNADAVVACPPPHLIQLLTSATGAAYAAPQLRIYNDKMYNVSLRVQTIPTSSVPGRSASCLVYDQTQTISSQQAIIVTLPFSSTCDGLSVEIQAAADPGVVGGEAPSPCWSWTGNLTTELAANKLEQLQASRVAAGKATVDGNSNALQTGLDLTTEVLAGQVESNEMTRIAALYAALGIYSSETAASALRAINHTRTIDAGSVPTIDALNEFRSILAQIRLGQSNTRALILAASASSAAGYAAVLAANQEATDARLAFAATSAAVMANITATAAYLNAHYYSAQSLRDRAAAAQAKLDADVARLAAETQILQSVLNVMGTMPTALANHTFFPVATHVYDDFWGSMWNDLFNGVVALPGVALQAAIATVHAIVEAALDLVKDVACGFLPILCNSTILLLIIIVVVIIVFLCAVGPLLRR